MRGSLSLAIAAQWNDDRLLFSLLLSPLLGSYVAFLRHDGADEQSFSWKVYASFMLTVSPCEALQNSFLPCFGVSPGKLPRRT